MTAAIDVTALSYTYGSTRVLEVERCHLEAGASMIVRGPSGCGKTTFLHVLSGLISPDRGEISVLGQDLLSLKGTKLDRFRGRHIGLIFQRFHLVPALNVYWNVALAQRLGGGNTDAPYMNQLLDQLGLTEFAHQKPSELSAGQAQRVAIARALAHRPKLIMADEPTSALDDANAENAIGLLRKVAASVGAALLIATHDSRLRGCLDQELKLEAPL